MARPGLGDRVGPYRVDAVLAYRAYGTLYRASAPSGAAVSVALLELPLERLAPYLAVRRAVDAIGDPGIARLVEAGALEPAVSFLVEEFYRGRSLARTLAVGPLGTDALTPVVTRLADLLGRALAGGHPHGLLRSSWIRIGSGADLRVHGHGSWMLLAPGSAPALRLPPRVLAPEVLVGANPDARTDVYGLGLVLYEACVGEVPFTPATAIEETQRVLTGGPRPPRRVRPELAPAIEDLLLRALEREPDRRFASPAALAHAWAELAPARSDVLVGAARSSPPAAPAGDEPLGRGARIGRYVVDGFLGRGGFAFVHRGLDVTSGQTVALKVGYERAGDGAVTRLGAVPHAPRPGGVPPDEVVARLAGGRCARAREVDRLLVAEHERLQVAPPIYARALELIEHDGRAVLVLEHVAGETWRAAMRRGRPLDLALLGRVLRAVVDYPHGDLKPENILLAGDEVRLIDPAPPEGLTPEYNPLGLTGAAADAYAVAVITYEVLTGHRPALRARGALVEVPESPRHPSAGELCDAIVEWLTRPQDGRVIADALERLALVVRRDEA